MVSEEVLRLVADRAGIKGKALLTLGALARAKQPLSAVEIVAAADGVRFVTEGNAYARIANLRRALASIGVFITATGGVSSRGVARYALDLETELERPQTARLLDVKSLRALD